MSLAFSSYFQSKGMLGVVVMLQVFVLVVILFGMNHKVAAALNFISSKIPYQSDIIVFTKLNLWNILRNPITSVSEIARTYLI